MDNTNKRVLITGASGMVGGLLQDLALEDVGVTMVISLVRRLSGKSHPKLMEIVIDDFLNYSAHMDELSKVDVVFYCLGVYTGAVPAEQFRAITVDYPVKLASALASVNPKITFCLLSGSGADRSEKSKLMFARDKGAAENQIDALGFGQFYAFRPGYIYPSVPRKEPNFSYRVTRALYPLIKLFGKRYSITSAALAEAIFFTAMQGYEGTTLENIHIHSQSQKAQQR
jgi:uncharacterized protein YbjT (DUF2867 family)